MPMGNLPQRSVKLRLKNVIKCKSLRRAFGVRNKIKHHIQAQINFYKSVKPTIFYE